MHSKREEEIIMGVRQSLLMLPKRKYEEKAVRKKKIYRAKREFRRFAKQQEWDKVSEFVMDNPSLLEFGAQEEIAQQLPVQPAADVRRKRLAVHEKWAIVGEVQNHFPHGERPTEKIYEKVGRLFCRSTSTVRNVWDEYTAKLQHNPHEVPDLRRRFPVPGVEGRQAPVGRPSQLTGALAVALAEAAKRTRYRGTLRMLRDELRMAPEGQRSFTRALSTLHRYVRKLQYQRRYAYVKPTLRSGNKQKRLQFVLEERLEPDPVSNEHYRFKSLDNVVFVDEKYFPLFRTRHRIWAPPGVEVPAEHARNKDHVPAMMYLTAVMKPSVDLQTGTFNDGKIAMIPFANDIPAKRSSRNRPAGTLEMKPFTCNSETFYDAMTRPGGMIEKIREKLQHLQEREIVVVIQADNAPPHIGKQNIDRLNTFGAAQQGMKIRVVLQPPQSPDYNVLDLGLFHSLNAGTISYRHGVSDFGDLNTNLQQVFASYPNDVHERIYAKLLDIYRETLKVFGGNTYSLPHCQVRDRQSHGLPALNYLVDAETVNRARVALNAMRNQHAFVPAAPILNEDA